MKINWSGLLIILILSFFILMIGLKFVQNYDYMNDNWSVHQVNFGFAIVENEDKQQLLVRNPTANLKEGDEVIVKGFKFTLDSNVAYIDSKK